MMDEKFIHFLARHHVLNLSTCNNNTPYAASCFYAYDIENARFIVASDANTRHMQEALENPKVAGTVTLETKSVGLIQGMQFMGELKEGGDEERRIYYQCYPFARAMNPTIWQIIVNYAKLTDNRLGFGNKLEFTRE